MIKTYSRNDIENAVKSGKRYLVVNHSDNIYLVDAIAECHQNDLVMIQNGRDAHAERLNNQNADSILGKILYIVPK